MSQTRESSATDRETDRAEFIGPFGRAADPKQAFLRFQVKKTLIHQDFWLGMFSPVAQKRSLRI